MFKCVSVTNKISFINRVEINLERRLQLYKTVKEIVPVNECIYFMKYYMLLNKVY